MRTMQVESCPIVYITIIIAMIWSSCYITNAHSTCMISWPLALSCKSGGDVVTRQGPGMHAILFS